MKISHRIVRLVVLCFAILFCILKSGDAQPLKFGVQSGANVSSHLHDLEFQSGNFTFRSTPKMALNYQAGIILRKDFSKIFRLQLEPTFIELGANYKENFSSTGIDVPTEGRSEMYYIQVPLVMQLSTKRKQKNIYGLPVAKTTYHFTAGVFGGYLIDADYTGTNAGSDEIFHKDLRSMLPSYEAGPVLGLGFEHGQDNKFGIETRAFISLLNSANNTNLPQNIAATLSLYIIL